MEILLDELIKLILSQMQSETALSDEKKEHIRKAMEQILVSEGVLCDEKK